LTTRIISIKLDLRSLFFLHPYPYSHHACIICFSDHSFYSRGSESSLMYRLGPYEYIVQADTVVATSLRPEVRFSKPKGKIRSFRLFLGNK